MNGRVGIVQRDTVAASEQGRLVVLLDGETEAVSIREANLRKADGFDKLD